MPEFRKNLFRRGFLGAAAGGVTLALAGPILPARADIYPNKPIRLIVGYLPGAATDFTARVMAEAMTKLLGQPVVVENKPGASAAIAVNYVTKSPPDGYTLLYTNSDAVTLLPAEKPSTPYRMPDDFTFIGRVLEYGYALTVSARLPVNSVADLVAYAKANPGKLRYGTSGVGGSQHLAGLLFAQQADIDMKDVPYRGAAAEMTDLLGGFIDMAFMSRGSVGDQDKTGKVRLISTTTGKRDVLMPDVPTLAEAGYPGATMNNWDGIVGPAGMPAEVTARLRAAVTEAMKDPTVAPRFVSVDMQPSPLIGDDYEKLVVGEYQKWQEMVKNAHLVIQ